MKIFHWIFGSFFRTIGRTIALLLMGGLFYYILSINDIGIKDLFFENVKADTFLNTFATNWTNDQGQYLGTISEYAYQTASTTTQDGQFTANNFYINLVADQSKGSYIEIPFYMTIPNVSTNLSSTVYGQDMCTRYDCALLDTSTNTCSRYTCVYTSTGQDSTITDRERIIFQSEVYSIVVYNTGYVDVCNFDKTKNNIVCPITSNQPVQYINRVVVWTKVYGGSTATNYQYQVGLGIRSRAYKNDTQSIIDNQNQNTQSVINQQQNSTQQMLDDNTTQAQDDAEGFFSSFSTPDVGGLSAIITAPLNTIRSLLNSTCTNLVLPLPYVDKDLTLPCMNDIYTQHFGLFFTLYQTIILAIISYRCIRSVFFDIKGFSNPDDDRIEVMDL